MLGQSTVYIEPAALFGDQLFFGEQRFDCSVNMLFQWWISDMVVRGDINLILKHQDLREMLLSGRKTDHSLFSIS